MIDVALFFESVFRVFCEVLLWVIIGNLVRVNETWSWRLDWWRDDG